MPPRGEIADPIPLFSDVAADCQPATGLGVKMTGNVFNARASLDV
jgi:hypothetical protein